jgi:ribosome-associated protein
MNSRETALMATKAIADKKGWDITVLELKEVSLITDYFVIANGNSRIQTQAIADSIEEELKKAGILLARREGYTEGTWILLDYGFMIVHVFLKDQREFYSLERLWGDAPRIPVQV